MPAKCDLYVRNFNNLCERKARLSVRVRLDPLEVGRVGKLTLEKPRKLCIIGKVTRRYNIPVHTFSRVGAGHKLSAPLWNMHSGGYMATVYDWSD